MNALIPAREVDDLIRGTIAGDAYANLVGTMYVALAAALATTTCTFSCASYPTAAIKLIKDLRDLGYDVSRSGSNITITWGKRTEPTLIAY